MGYKDSYDGSLDQVVKEIGYLGSLFFGDIRQYNGGASKVVISKLYGYNNSKKSQLFRLDVNECKMLVALLNEAIIQNKF
jgi:hypothetical protein